MNYADIKEYDVANGPGVRVTLFVSGCTHRCKECFNPETWDFDYGKPYTDQTTEYLLKLLSHDYVRGLTLLGGDPLEKVNQEGLLPLLRAAKKSYPDKDIWCFTGYDFGRDVLGHMMGEWEMTKEFLSYIDVLVDGEFQIEKKDLNLKFKGSSNQKTILVKESLQTNQICLLPDT